jgi:hypothetical protein
MFLPFTYYFYSPTSSEELIFVKRSEQQRLLPAQQAHMQNTVGDGAVFIEIEAGVTVHRDIHLLVARSPVIIRDF